MGTYNRILFYDSVRSSLFPSGMSQQQVEGMNALMAYIDRLEWHPTEANSQYFNYWNAYNFATTFHETAFTMWPVTEYGSQSYLQGKSYYPYIGRGFVQMTWEDNYKRSDREIAEGDLISAETLAKLPDSKVNQHQHVEQALDLEIAACNLMIGCWQGWWTGRKLTHYLTNTNKDYINARRIVNGTDKATTIAGYAEKFETAFVLAWQKDPIEIPEPELPPPMPPPGTPSPVEPSEGIPMHILEQFAETGENQISKQRETEPGVFMTSIWNRPDV